MAARSLDAYLNKADGLARLSAHAGRLLKLQRIYEKIAPSSLVAASRVANYRLGKVVIHADSGAVAAKLRQLRPSLVGDLSLEGVEVTEMQVKVQPVYAASQHRRALRSPSVGSAAKSGLSRLADSLPADSPLKDALGRLVRDSR
ncbi:MAG TPA: DciA family protein [Candidatus Desulfobacillus sp.]|nr:DciA family protein [Candidatus Desulfobacillus sp.]